MDVSCTLFRSRSLVLVVATDQDDMLGYGDLFRQHDELKEKWENSKADKELVKLQKKVKLADYLQEEVK